MFDAIDLEIVFTVLLIAAVGFVALRQGKANPVGTGQLDRDVAAVKADIAGVKKDVGGVRTALTNMEASLGKMQDELDGCPTGDDITALKELVRSELSGLDREIAGVKQVTEKTDQAVIRIEMLLMERALPPAQGGRSRR